MHWFLPLGKKIYSLSSLPCLQPWSAKLAVKLANSVSIFKCLRDEPQLLFSGDSEQPPWQPWLHREGRAPQAVVC